MREERAVRRIDGAGGVGSATTARSSGRHGERLRRVDEFRLWFERGSEREGTSQQQMRQIQRARRSRSKSRRWSMHRATQHQINIGLQAL